MVLMCFRIAICCIEMAVAMTYAITTETWQTSSVMTPVQVCGDVILVQDERSLTRCAINCMYHVYTCFMFEFNITTNVCRLYSGIANQNATRLSPWIPFPAFKGIANCERSGYNHVANEKLCFKTFKEKMTWYDANTKCLEENGRLAVLTTSGQIEALLKHASANTPGMLWIGMTDAENEGIWKWVDNTTFDPSIWHLTQFNDFSSSYPADKFTADCAAINTNSDYIIDSHCLFTSGFVCERPQLLL